MFDLLLINYSRHIVNTRWTICQKTNSWPVNSRTGQLP